MSAIRSKDERGMEKRVQMLSTQSKKNKKQSETRREKGENQWLVPTTGTWMRKLQFRAWEGPGDGGRV